MPTNTSKSLVLVSKQNGLVIIPGSTPLTRLNYFDGKFLRASDLKAEQDYLRHLVNQSNQAGGSGVVHGFNVTLAGGDTLAIGPGLAIDPEGRVLLLPQGSQIVIQELIDKSRDLEKLFGKPDVKTSDSFAPCEIAGETPPVNTTSPNSLYLIVISSAEALCGEEDVYGKLCEEACATSTDRPLAVEGLIVRAIPLVLKTPLPNSPAALPSQLNFRSRVASAYFEDERDLLASLISAEGLKQATWCQGANAAADGGVPIGVLARGGGTTIFLDPWIARRELIDTSPRRYWQWRMMMRPWDVFLAQILQFQCQLRDLFKNLPNPGVEVDPCGGARDLLSDAKAAIQELQKYYEATSGRLAEGNRDLISFEGGSKRLILLNSKLEDMHKALSAVPADRWLINGGIVELPSAGYLPVVPGVGSTINQQVRKMMGEGVDLRFCIVRPDYVAHALEEVQHMERISLTAGLDDPKKKQEVDILVPNGEIVESKAIDRGGFEASFQILPNYVNDLVEIVFPGWNNQLGDFLDVIDEEKIVFTFDGAARRETLANSHSFYAAMLMDDSVVQRILGSFVGRAALGMLVGGALPSPATQAESAKPSEAEETEINEAKEAKGSRLLSRFKTLAAKRLAAKETSPDPSASTAVEPKPVQIVVGGKKPPPSETGAFLPGGLWIEATCNQDLRKIDKNIPLRITARVILGGLIPVRTGGVRAYLDLHLTIDTFDLELGAKADGSRFIKCAASVWGGVITGYDETKDSDSRRVDEEVEISWTSAAGGTHIEVSVHDPDSELTFVFAGDFGASSGALLGNIKTGDKSGKKFRQEDDFNVGLSPNADVFKPDNDEHVRALQALETIGTALKSPGFFQMASGQLFPPAPKAADELIVRGTQDWVLFHRRRDRKCGVEIPPPAPPPPVKTVCHTVYRTKDKRHFALAVSMIEQFIENGDGDLNQVIERAQLINLGDVLFEERSGKFAGDGKTIDDVVTAWNKDGGKATVAAIFGRAGTLSLNAQANAIVKKVNQGAGVAQSRVFSVPASIDLPTECPAFSILVAQEQASCMSVYRTPDRVGFQEIRALVDKLGSTGNFMNDVVGIKAFSFVGDVEFEANTTNDVDGTLAQMKAEWIKQKGGQVLSHFLVWHESEEGSTFQNQASRIREEIGTTAVSTAFAKPVSDGITFPTACPAIMVVWETVPPRTGVIHLVTASGAKLQTTAVQPLDVAFDPGANLTTSLSNLVKTLETQKKIPIMRVELAPNAAEVQNTANARLQSVVAALNNAAVGTLNPSGVNAVVPLKPAEQFFKTMKSGAQADDVIFLITDKA